MFFERKSFELEAFLYIKMGLSLEKQLISPQKIITIIIEMGDDLGYNNIQKHGDQTVLQNYLHDEDKGVREETIFYFQIECCFARFILER